MILGAFYSGAQAQTPENSDTQTPTCIPFTCYFRTFIDIISQLFCRFVCFP